MEVYVIAEFVAAGFECIRLAVLFLIKEIEGLLPVVCA